MIAAHNHSSDTVEQSSEDREITERLRQAGETLGVRLLDHIVFSGAWAARSGGSPAFLAKSPDPAANSPAQAASGAEMRYYSFLEKGVW